MGDEGLLRVLLRASSSLTSIADLLRWTEDEGGRLRLQVEPPRDSFRKRLRCFWLFFKSVRLSQTLSSELDALSAELSCLRSKVSGRSGIQQCLDDAFRVLSVIRASVAFREKQLSDLKQEDVQVSPRHRRYHGDQPADY